MTKLINSLWKHHSNFKNISDKNTGQVSDSSIYYTNLKKFMPRTPTREKRGIHMHADTIHDQHKNRSHLKSEKKSKFREKGL